MPKYAGFRRRSANSPRGEPVKLFVVAAYFAFVLLLHATGPDIAHLRLADVRVEQAGSVAFRGFLIVLAYRFVAAYAKG